MKRLSAAQSRATGFTLVEVMVVVVILAAMLMAVYAILMIGQVSWFDTDASIELQQNLRLIFSRLTREVQQSGRDAGGALQLTVFDDAGINGTDILRFSIPVICESGGSIIDNNGAVAHWGAPLRWGCTDSACMDADDDCATVDYKYIEYRMNGSSQLVRRVLDESAQPVREQILGHNVIDFQVGLNGDVVTIGMSVQKRSAVGRVLAVTEQAIVSLRNRG